MEEIRDVYKNSVGKPEGKRPFGAFRHRQEDNNKMDDDVIWCGFL
jgi:hypothetical protein